MPEDDDAENLGIGRYAVMPSLVVQQQMKNRLALATLGKKLMKFAAMATGRELRKISCDINEAYKGLGNDIREAFIELARCRYLDPGFNAMVLQNITQKASISVKSSVRSVSGVKVIIYKIVDNNQDPYPLLLSAKCSEEVKRVKQMWRDLLLRLIIILQLRQSFISLDDAHKSATKRQNVLAKVVIPKTKNTLRYILLELEELAREELYRIKKIKQKKEQKSLKKQKKLPCPLCGDKYRQNPTVDRCIWCGDWIGIDQKSTKTYEMTNTLKSVSEIIPEDIAINNLCRACMDEYEDLYCNQSHKILSIVKPDDKEKHVLRIVETENDEKGAEDSKETQSETEYINESYHEFQNAIIKDSSNIASTIKRKDDKMATPVKSKEDLSLGIYETTSKEVTKIVRTINKDGSITEEAVVIRVEKNVHKPNIVNNKSFITEEEVVVRVDKKSSKTL